MVTTFISPVIVLSTYGINKVLFSLFLNAFPFLYVGIYCSVRASCVYLSKFILSNLLANYLEQCMKQLSLTHVCFVSIIDQVHISNYDDLTLHDFDCCCSIFMLPNLSGWIYPYYLWKDLILLSIYFSLIVLSGMLVVLQ